MLIVIYGSSVSSRQTGYKAHPGGEKSHIKSDSTCYKHTTYEYIIFRDVNTVNINNTTILYLYRYTVFIRKILNIVPVDNKIWTQVVL